MEMLQARFEIDEERASIHAITIREINGKDERIARAQAKARNSDEIEELVRLSITHVNDEPVEQPCDAYDDWNFKTRAWVKRAFTTVNGIDLEKIGPFEKAATFQPLTKSTTTMPRIGAATSG
jgi:hypothetical protein